jgi:hypothetical protein
MQQDLWNAAPDQRGARWYSAALLKDAGFLRAIHYRNANQIPEARSYIWEYENLLDPWATSA